MLTSGLHPHSHTLVHTHKHAHTNTATDFRLLSVFTSAAGQRVAVATTMELEEGQDVLKVREYILADRKPMWKVR